MSHWKKGKLSLKCSLDVLRRAMIKLKPEWEKHIQVDPSGKIAIENSYLGTTMDGYSLKVDHKMARGISYADVGFKGTEEGGWNVDFDPDGLSISQFEGQIKAEVAMEKIRNAAAMGLGEILEDETSKSGRKIVFKMPVDPAYRTA